ncbi:hypothetical protein H4R19_004242 [Coemansia spiralis]|nr:hypothetical protein H4R19_004242 [Coemansia spiralis]
MARSPDEATPILRNNDAASAADAESGLCRHRCSRRRRVLYACSAGLLAALFVGGLFALASTSPAAPGRSTLVTARQGAVATDEPRCSAIGADVLRDGGNAVDAAVASALCIGVLQAHSSGIGGGGFMLVRPPHGVRPVLIDFRETAGAAATADMFADDITRARIGGMAVGVPGEIAGLHSAHARFGRLPWHRLFEPSIALSRDGFVLGPAAYQQVVAMRQHIVHAPGFNTTYADGHGNLLGPADTVRRPELASTLEAIARDGPRAFYEGRIARSLTTAIQDNGGILTMDDFAAYRPVDRQPIEGFYHGRKILTGAPPTSGSILLNMLNIVEGYTLALEGPAAVNYHRLVEAMKFGAAQRTFLADPSFVDIGANVSRQISKQFASDIRANISDTETFGLAHYAPEYDVLNNHGTTHISVLDKDEMAVSLTSTINLEFGARIMDPRTGVILNDEMDDFSTTNMTNGFGLRPSPNNKIVPGKRPLSSTSATIVENNGRVELVVGGSGGSRILTAVLQVIVNVLDFGMRLDDAIDRPRLHHQLIPETLGVDPLFPSSLANALAARGHKIAPISHGNSVVQAVHRLPSGLLHAVSDARKHGLAAGY